MISVESRNISSQQAFPLPLIHKGKAPDPPLQWSKAGFTLVELLVVVAIIAVLAALLLPAISQSKSAAQSAKCKSNLRQVGLALNMYVADFKAYPYATVVTPAGDWKNWVIDLAPYLGITGAQGTPTLPLPPFRCPEQYTQLIYDGTPNGQVIGSMRVFARYGYNWSGTGWDKPLGLGVGIETAQPVPPISENMVRVPSDMMAAGCVANFYALKGVMAFFNQPSIQWPLALHRGGANVTFCDGHVEYAKQAQWIRPTDAIRRRWNNDNEPHRETWQ